MKKFLLFATLWFAVFYCFANGSEKVCVVTNSGSYGQACSATELGNISLSGIKPGTYTLSVFDGNSWSNSQIVVQ